MLTIADVLISKEPSDFILGGTILKSNDFREMIERSLIELS